MFGSGDVESVVRRMAALDPAACDRAALAEIVGLAQRVRSWLDAVDVAVARRSTELGDAGRCETAEMVLSHGGRRSGREARAAARRSAACERVPALETALAAGQVSAGHVDAVALLVNGLDDAGRARLDDHAAALAAAAKREPVRAFERRCHELGRRLARDEGESRLSALKRQCRVRRWTDGDSGMRHSDAALDPESDARLWTALDARADLLRRRPEHAETPRDQLVVAALLELVCRDGTTDARRVPEVVVLVDLATLTDGLHAHSVCELSDGTAMPPASVRRLACDAAVIPVVLGGGGEALDVGREARLANRAQRRALRAMYRSCAWPDCTVPFDRCQIHHTTAWRHLGPTDLADLVPVCDRHHHHVHDHHWTLVLHHDAVRTITITRPDGTRHHEGPSVQRTARHGDADIGPERIGSPPGQPAGAPSVAPPAPAAPSLFDGPMSDDQAAAIDPNPRRGPPAAA